MVKAGITGAGGLVGEGLIRTLLGHPEVELVYVESAHAAGKPIADEFPSLEGDTDIVFDAPDLGKAVKKADILFLAHKGTESMKSVPVIIEAGKKAIDIGGEFRLRSAAEYEKWYGSPHTAKEYLDRAVYGLPELFRDKIRKAELVANPGCYPTGLILLVAPLLKAGVIKGKIQASGFSGLTGAGRQYSQKNSNLFLDINENMRPYSALKHRHQPEMSDALERYLARKVEVAFAPHLAPFDRGILTVVWAEAAKDVSAESIHEAYSGTYGGESFIRIRQDASQVAVKNVFGSNYCDIGFAVDGRTMYLVSAIDNTTKGAVTQAVQNMNIMFGLEETAGIVNRFI
jgi:N-acetyl-gamma-glutamyl-phosphate reductase